MNVKLLRKIAKVIQEKPKEFDMRFLHTDIKTKTSVHSPKGCETAHCIAGWAQILEKDDRICNSDGGARAFGVDGDSLRRLLFTYRWPTKFARLYWSRKTYPGKAKVAAARIEHFIATNGQE